jgi:hypothetical protein
MYIFNYSIGRDPLGIFPVSRSSSPPTILAITEIITLKSLKKIRNVIFK